MYSKTNAQSAQQTAYAFSKRFFVLVALLGITLFARAQPWPSSTSILQSDPQTGDTVSLVVTLGSSTNQLSNESSLSFSVAYPSHTTPIGDYDIDVSNSFFVCPGCYTATVTADDAAGELNIDLELNNGGTGNGHGELLRLHGGAIIEDILKRAKPAKEQRLPQLFVFPNPTADVLQVRLPEYHGEMAIIHDVQGRITKRIPVKKDASLLLTSVGDLPPGLYWFSIPQSGKQLSSSFVVK